MGNYLARQWVSQGYYFDMVCGFPTDAGGYSTTILYPEGLLDLPKRCPKCKKSSGLQFLQMRQALLDARSRFMFHAEAVVAQRHAKGDPEPYLGFIAPKKSTSKDEDAEEKQTPKTPTSGFLSSLKNNGVSPLSPQTELEKEIEEIERIEDYMGFEIDRSALVFCSCNPREPESYEGMGFGKEEKESAKDKLDDWDTKPGRRSSRVSPN